MVAEIRGSRQTIATRYEMHAQQKRQQALANMPPSGSSIFIVPGCQCQGMYGGYNMGGFGGMPGMGMGGFGAPPACNSGMPSWLNQFFAGTAIGQSLYNIGSKIFGG